MKKLLAAFSAALVIVVGLVALTACGSTTVKVVHSNTPSTAPGSNSAFKTWYHGAGFSDFQAVENDVSQMSTDAGNGNATAVESDGTQLATDAATAAADPCPIDSSQYALAMTQLGDAGTAASTGDFTTATQYVTKANTTLAKLNSQLQVR